MVDWLKWGIIGLVGAGVALAVALEVKEETKWKPPATQQTLNGFGQAKLVNILKQLEPGKVLERFETKGSEQEKLRKFGVGEKAVPGIETFGKATPEPTPTLLTQPKLAQPMATAEEHVTWAIEEMAAGGKLVSVEALAERFKNMLPSPQLNEVLGNLIDMGVIYEPVLGKFKLTGGSEETPIETPTPQPVLAPVPTAPTPSIGTYSKDLETGRLELYFNKKDYDALPDDKKKEIKSQFLWSPSRGAWVSRATRSLSWPETIAKKLGLTFEGETGEKLTFAEQKGAEAERAEARAERFETRSEKAAREAKARQAEFNKYRGDIAFLTQPASPSSPFGRARERIFKRYEKGFESMEKSEHYADRAKIAERTASQVELKSPAFLSRRIEEAQAEIRGIQRRMEEVVKKVDSGTITYDPKDHLQRLNDLLDEYLDKLAFYQEKLKEAGGVKFNRENLAGKTHVLYRGKWYPVVRLNPKTVTISNWIDIPTWKWQAPYAEIREARP